MRADIQKLLEYLPKIHSEALYLPAFIPILEALLDFIEKSESIYSVLLDKPKKMKYIAQVANAIMGAGKSTALQLIAIWAIQNNTPLLCVFNNNDNLKSFIAFVSEYANKYGFKEGAIRVNNQNFNEVAHQISQYTVVAITQQRFRDIALGYGEFSIFKSYEKLVQQFGHNNRTIIFDEMPIFIDAEIYDIGGQNNIVNWFDEMTKNVKLADKDIRQARLTISYMFNCELNEVLGDDHVSIPTKRLKRHIEGSEKEEQLNRVLDLLNKNVKTESLNRRKWFKRLLTKDEVGIVNRDNKQSLILCADFIDYTKFGNLLVLDGTADITKSIYRHGGFEFISLPNYHNYKERLKLWCKEINTSKESRKNEETHQIIADDLRSFDEPILPLPLKQDLPTYLKLGAITNEQSKKFFQGRTVEDESLALNLLNTTGKNELAEYNNLALLSLPLRHSSYYKLFALAMYGTATNVSLMDTKSGRQLKETVKWFTDEKVQDVYKQLVLMDFSQIIHRSSLRYMKDHSKVKIYIYTNRTGWLNDLQKIYKLPEQNINIRQLTLTNRFKQNCQDKAVNAREILFQKGYFPGSLVYPSSISRSFKDWLNNNWNNVQRKRIIVEVFQKHNMEIVEEIKGNKMYKRVRIL